jgi:hypothetical protein
MARNSSIGEMTIREASSKDNNDLIDLLKSNPIKMEASFVIDRSPDFFRLHRALAGSATFVAASPSDPSTIQGCFSMFRMQGRIGGHVVPFDYITDLNRRPGRAGFGATLALSRNFYARTWQTNFATALVNDQNKLVISFINRDKMSFKLEPLGTQLFSEHVPLKTWSLPKGYSASFPCNAAELTEGLALINEHYKSYALYDPLTPESFKHQTEQMPSFTSENLQLLKKDGRIVAAAIWYEPSEITRVIIDKFDKLTAMASPVMSWINNITGLFAQPPQEGRHVKSLHIRRFAAADTKSEQLLFKQLANLARIKKMHTMAVLTDERAPVKLPPGLTFKYRLILYASAKDPSVIETTRTELQFCDVTYS